MKKVLTILIAVAIAYVIFQLLGILAIGLFWLIKWIVFGVVAILVYIFLKDKI